MNKAKYALSTSDSHTVIAVNQKDDSCFIFNIFDLRNTFEGFPEGQYEKIEHYLQNRQTVYVDTENFKVFLRKTKYLSPDILDMHSVMANGIPAPEFTYDNGILEHLLAESDGVMQEIIADQTNNQFNKQFS